VYTIRSVGGIRKQAAAGRAREDSDDESDEKESKAPPVEDGDYESESDTRPAKKPKTRAAIVDEIEAAMESEDSIEQLAEMLMKSAAFRKAIGK
jgi:hypothetical protein